jgi:predicted transcriptional regulator of viral defense system
MFTVSPTSPRGIEQHTRGLLEQLHRGVTGPFTVAEAAALLSLDRAQVRRLLVYLAARGWLARIRRGLYTTVPLGATAPSEWREDPWVVAAHSFAPCYLGGWSAAEHWGLTEQIFREIVVVTSTPVRERTMTLQGTVFQLKFRREALQFGTRPVWRGQTRVLVSDPSRTLVDVLDDPSLGGGIRHVAEMLGNNFDSEHREDDRLLDYAERLGNRTVFKRLGFLIETLSLPAPQLAQASHDRQSSGLTTLDPTVAQPGRIVKRWNLRVNVALHGAGQPA